MADEERAMPDKVAMVSGGFDPLHVGHINLLYGARHYGLVLVALNSDEWLLRKKGYVFMLWQHRAAILNTLAVVDRVVSVDDLDGTVCEAIKKHRPHFFCNGGDRKRENTSPEARLCNELRVERFYNIGGPKVESSSALIERVPR